MFGKLKDTMKQLQQMQRLMKDENFKAFMSHPKVQELFRDPEFQALVKQQDPAKIASYPKLAALMRDPEVGQLMKKVDPAVLFQ